MSAGTIVIVGLAIVGFLLWRRKQADPSAPILPMTLSASRPTTLEDLATDFKDRQDAEAKRQAIKDNLSNLFGGEKVAPK